MAASSERAFLFRSTWPKAAPPLGGLRPSIARMSSSGIYPSCRSLRARNIGNPERTPDSNSPFRRVQAIDQHYGSFSGDVCPRHLEAEQINEWVCYCQIRDIGDEQDQHCTDAIGDDVAAARIASGNQGKQDRDDVARDLAVDRLDLADRGVTRLVAAEPEQ